LTEDGIAKGEMLTASADFLRQLEKFIDNLNKKLIQKKKKTKTPKLLSF